ncbi:uncharacterized protein HKW66_Vig0200380 [Vigna angularis]|uniref:Uncharacterized protein n=1 Tax=Phaseolus angularis TaxID=3914 RepID=A0A8T0JTZ3_PHAAN|nr:uncharacterized protein HKW66_Vig0200380 [Vigna angularis]
MWDIDSHLDSQQCFLPNLCVLCRLIFDAVSCGDTFNYRYRHHGNDEGNVGDFSLVASHAEKEERSEKRLENLSDIDLNSSRRNARFGRRSFANRFALCFAQSRNR